MQPAFPTHIDNSMRSEFVSCPRSFFNKYMLKRIPVIPSVHLHAGKAFASGMEATRKAFFDQGLSVDASLEIGYRTILEEYGNEDFGDDAVKTAERMAGALIFYFNAFPLDGDFVTPIKVNGKSMVEVNFALPIGVRHPDTNEPIIYFGRFDMVGESDKQIYIVDEKTTSSLGPTWGKKYEMSAQFTGYKWAMQEYGHDVSAILIRGVSILKTKYDKAQHIMYRPNWVVERWKQQLERDIQRMIECYKTNVWDYNLADSCGAYGGCDYQMPCQRQDEDAWLLGPDFMDNDYDPLRIIAPK